MGHQQHGPAFFSQGADDTEYFLNHLRVKGRGRLVEQDDLWLHGQRTRNGGALLLSAGKLCGVGMALVGDTYLGQQLFSHSNGLCLALTEDATRGFDDVIEHAHVRPQVEILEHEADLAAQAVDLPVIGGNQVAVARGLELQFFASHQNLALMRVFQQVDAAQQRGLA